MENLLMVGTASLTPLKNNENTTTTLTKVIKHFHYEKMFDR